MAVQYHKLLDRILIRRAAERESLERALGENRATPKVMLGLFCVLLAGLFAFIVPAVSLILVVGALVSFSNAFWTWREASRADEAIEEETKDEEYRRYLLAKLGPQRFDQLATAVSSGGSEQSIHGWLKPLGFDEQDIEYLLWLAENIVAQVKDGVAEVGGYNVRKPKDKLEARPAGPEQSRGERAAAAGANAPATLPALAAAKAEPAGQIAESAPPSPAAAPSNLSPEEQEKFRILGAQRKAEYEKWLAQGGGREGSPDDPLGKLSKYTPAQIEELKKKAQERRKKGEAPQSSAPAPAAKDHPEKFSEQELKELEKKALQRFEPRPKVEGEAASKERVLGEVFSEQDIQALAAKAERKEREKQNKALPPAEDHDPEFGEERS